MCIFTLCWTNHWTGRSHVGLLWLAFSCAKQILMISFGCRGLQGMDMIAFARMLDDEQSPHDFWALRNVSGLVEDEGSLHRTCSTLVCFALFGHTCWEQEQESDRECHSIPKEMERVPGCPMSFWNIRGFPLPPTPEETKLDLITVVWKP